MELDTINTPPRLQLNHPQDVDQLKFKDLSNPACSNAISSVGENFCKKVCHPRTPSKNCNSTAATGSVSSSMPSCMAPITTPPAKRFQRVRNPFEPVLTDCLHLPLIASPSLFQRPTTPQLSSTKFEWTIDDLSSLKPTHVEPHETQFQDSPDPEYEAKAQSAISSYFKDQQIVPSPVDCPLRSNRILLSELNANTPIMKPGRRIRDCGTQTELTLPLVLPQALEEALQLYIQPNLALPDKFSESRSCGNEISFSSDSNSTNTNVTEFKDISLRRKLFDIHNIVVLDNEDETTPTSKNKSNLCSSSSSTCGRIAIIGKLSDSDKSSFGSLSPISATDGLSISPHSSLGSAAKMRSSIHTFLQDLTEEEQLSPIHPPVYQSSRRCIEAVYTKPLNRNYPGSPINCSADFSMSECVKSGEKVTLDCSSSSPHLQHSSAEGAIELGQQSIDSNLNMRVNRLLVNSGKCSVKQRGRIIDGDMFGNDDTYEMIDEDNDMQVSHLSVHSLNCSSSNSSGTPRSKRRSANRKNLSQSFSLNWLEDDDEAESVINENMCNREKQLLDLPSININNVDDILVMQQRINGPNIVTAVQQNCDSNINKKESNDESVRAVFYRTDSGFNEMPASGSNSMCAISNGLQINEGLLGAAESYGACKTQLSPSTKLDDVSMVCCSTPSRRAAN